MADVDRLLHLADQSLPLGKDEWERLAVTFNSGRARGSPERDFESLRRKFKVLYSTRKPTGMPNMPPHILKAKELKPVTDEKANVVEMDDEVDRDQRYVEPNFSFEADPDDSLFEEDDDGEGVHLAQDTNELVIDASAVTDRSVAGASMASSHASTRSEFQELLASPSVSEGLEAFARTPRPEPLRADRTTYTSVSAAGFSKPRKPTANTAGSNASATEELPALYGNHPSLREENERKSEARRADEEQRRRDDVAAREAKLLSDKAEAEERRRQDKLDMEERARRDREEARARTQGLMLMIQAFTKKA
ncbi:unnamed protein product [Phytophthora fragariaefolia]|uniref:Unnamed protein product n=1 Tax=Phytophthora fragariaefolia TaxID=1490495 RepID=A0A9W6U1R0_9STRA|nr:unnamed protein product [Phytophthora fragariaefolia]